MNKTRELCPVSSAVLTIDGYFQSVSWFWVNPWELRSSLSFLFHSNEHTWEPVLTELRQVPVSVFHNLMHRSLSPPPEVSRLLWNGHQARALTAAMWSSKRFTHWFWPGAGVDEAIDRSQMWSRLSLPPLASSRPEPDHLSPQTSWECPW